MTTLYQTSAGGIVYKKVADKILWLIVQHSAHKGWVFPKGLVGDNVQNELMANAALREVQEEGGVKTIIIAKLPNIIKYSYKWKNDFIHKTVHYYLMEYVSGDPANHDWEMSESKFITAEEIKSLLTYDADRDAFRQALELLNPY